MFSGFVLPGSSTCTGRTLFSEHAEEEEEESCAITAAAATTR
jgi:hypothetical protein